MDRRMDGRTDGWTDGWRDGLMDGWMDGWMDGKMNGWVNGQTDGWMDEWTDRWIGEVYGDLNTHISLSVRPYTHLALTQILLSMGISENAAKRGLYYTGDTNADQAAAWVFENLENPDLHKPFTPPQGASTTTPDYKALQASLDESRAFKMVFVVNMSLGMGVGKIATQVGHATLAIYKTLLINVSEQVNVREWEGKGAKKIVLKGTNAEHLLALKQMAERQNIIHFMIQDAGIHT